jgi:hypothetical protein
MLSLRQPGSNPANVAVSLLKDLGLLTRMA